VTSNTLPASRAWQPTCSIATAKRRAAMLANARAFFANRGLLEVETPVLSPCAVSDPNIESIRAVLSLDNGRHRYLHTSPEYCMKRLLCAGYPDLYSICRVFRDGDAGRWHQPEFTMAEWYRIGFGLQQMIAECCDFLQSLIDPERLQSAITSYSYSQACLALAGIDPLRADGASLADALHADDRLRNAIGNDRDEWLDLMLSSKVAPGFAKDRLTVVHHYPASQAALARLCPDNPLLADRFEVFFGALELANGYVELRDPEAQWQRWQNDLSVRQRKQQASVSLDSKLIDALRSGMPACAGVAVGLDRILMINERVGDIGKVQTFAFEG
jgi:elongation factor P--(R)-beta-lysine ligase